MEWPHLESKWRNQGFDIVQAGSGQGSILPDGPVWLASVPPPPSFDPLAWLDLHEAAGRPVSIAVHRNSDSAGRRLALGADASLQVLEDEAPDRGCWYPAGIALMESRILLPLIGTHPLAWRSIVDVLLVRTAVSGFPLPGRSSEPWTRKDSYRTLFLDRDGVINERIPDDYVRRPNEFHFMPGVLDALAMLRPMFTRMVVVTNHQGIGKGWMSEDDLDTVHQFMIDAMLARGIHLDGVYHCPELAVQRPLCRKPLPGMALQALVDHPDIDPFRSVMVGDSLSDIQFGQRLGMYTVKVGEATGLENLRVDGLLDFVAQWPVTPEQ